jgi:hypothetical protein
MQNLGLSKKQKKIMEQISPNNSHKKTLTTNKKGQKPEVKGFKNF